MFKPSVKKKSGISMGDKLFDTLNLLFWVIVIFIVAYPLWLILIASVSDPEAVLNGKVYFWPVQFSLSGYQAILKNDEMLRAYLNSIIYTVSGTSLSVFITMMSAYVLTQKFAGKSFVNFLIVFTMFFSGGLVPSYLINRELGFYNSPMAMIILNMLSVFNLMVARTYITTNIPQELHEAAMIDGANQYQCFFRIVLPLSGVIITVLSVYYGIAKWNDYFTAMIYIHDRKLMPLQTILRDVLASLNSTAGSMFESNMDGIDVSLVIRQAEVAKYCCIVVSTVPMVILYVFLQKYFVKGVMIGSLKG